MQPDQHYWFPAKRYAVLSLLLVGICWLKGEPPRWRWGGD